MLALRCQQEGQATIVAWSALLAVENTTGGIVVRHRCPCGQIEQHRTGRMTLAVAGAPG